MKKSIRFLACETRRGYSIGPAQSVSVLRGALKGEAPRVIRPRSAGGSFAITRATAARFIRAARAGR